MKEFCSEGNIISKFVIDSNGDKMINGRIVLLKVRHRKRGETNAEEQSRLARYSGQRHTSVLFSQQHRRAEYKGE